MKKNTESNNLNLNNNLFFYGDNLDGLSKLINMYHLDGKIDLIYIDPPFNTNQTFFVSENRNNSISRVKNGNSAYFDKMQKTEYLSFLKERLLLMHKLLSANGSIYLHIDCKIGHYVKILMDEVFGEDCFINDITRVKSNPKNFSRKAYGNEKDMILFYSKQPYANIWNEVKIKINKDEIERRFNKIDDNGRRYTTIPLHAPGVSLGATGQMWRGMNPPEGRHWRTDPNHFDEMDKLGKIEWSANGNPRIKKYADEHKGKKVQDIWYFKDPQYPKYPTQKNIEMIKFIIKQSSNPDSIILDCFAGGSTTLLAANQLKRRWIGMDNSEYSYNVFSSYFTEDEYILMK